MDITSDKYQIIFVYAVLALTPLLVFRQVRSFDFINYDDQVYVSENRQVQAGLTLEGIRWAFTTTYASYWHPLTWLSHMLDCQLFGLNAGRHHLTNLLFHTVNTLLLFTCFRKMTGAVWKSAFVAALFALHPLHVESVAWISERKDVLSTFFWLLSVLAYLGYVKRPAIHRYLLLVIAFASGLMSKPMLVTLPFVLLLLDFWPLGRFQRNASVLFRLFLEKLPLFMLSLIFSVVTFIAQRSVGAVAKMDSIPFDVRLYNALAAYFKYIYKMFWPTKLAVLYPHPGSDLPIWEAAAAAIFLFVITASVIRYCCKYGYLLTGWFWYLGMLVPVIGLVQVGPQSRADRYTYVPLTGLFLIISWLLPDLLKNWRLKKPALGASAALLASVLAAVTFFQTRLWQNSFTLSRGAIEVTENNYIMHNNLGHALQSEGRFEEAIVHFYEALRIRPDFDNAHYNLGLTFQSQGRLKDAVNHYRQALEVQPDHFEAHNNLGVILQSSGRYDEAIDHFRKAIQIKGDYTEAYNNLGNTLQIQGKLDEAIGHYIKALSIDSRDARTHSNLGIALAAQGKLDKATEHYRQGLKTSPDNTDILYNLGTALRVQGRLAEAANYYRQALKINPDDAEVHNGLGLALSAQGKIDEAARHYLKALELKDDHIEARCNLGDLFQAQGRSEEAIEHYRRVVSIRPDWPVGLNSLAWILATAADPNVREVNEAIALAERAAGLTNYQDAYILDTLATAYAGAGRYDEAIKAEEGALESASTNQNDALSNHIRRQIELYRKEKP